MLKKSLLNRTLAVFALLGAIGVAQVLRTGPQVEAFFSEIDDSDQPYALYLPKNFALGKKYPLVISLHGAGSNHRLNLRRVFGVGNLPNESDPEATRYFPRLHDVDFIVASPYARGTMGYQGVPERDVYDVLADVKKRFAIDEDRIYLTGLSMGGGGSMWLGLTRPDLWAAVAPVCPAVPADASDLAGNGINVPFKIFQGGADPLVKPEITRQWLERLKGAGVETEYVEYPGVRHNSWDFAYKDAAIFEWFSKYRRNRYPERVRFSTREYTYREAYWVVLDAFTPGDLALIDARFNARNDLVIETKALDAFTLRLDSHPSWRKALPLHLKIDGTILTTRPGAPLSFFRSPRGWVRGAYKPALREKRPGQSGPVRDVIANRHLYVYGTADTPSPDVLLARRNEAQRAAEWSTTRAPLSIRFRVVSDDEVRPSDLDSANLVLFGSAATNKLIAKVAAQLPAELNASAADFGLVMAVPFGSRMAIINSGLPWWTRADQARRPGLAFINAPYRILQSFEDFICFRGGLDEVVAEGRFDRNWKLPSDAAERLRASGAVTIH